MQCCRIFPLLLRSRDGGSKPPPYGVVRNCNNSTNSCLALFQFHRRNRLHFLFPVSFFPLPVFCFLLSPFNNLIINFSPTVQKAAVAGGRQPLWLLCKTFSDSFSACVRLPVCLGASQISNVPRYRSGFLCASLQVGLSVCLCESQAFRVPRCRSGFLCTSVKVRLSVYLVAGRGFCVPL